MPSPKRASMREGPLAALFRKTADDPGAADPEPPPKREPHPALETPPPEPRTEEAHEVP
jgi:hypothetical protein